MSYEYEFLISLLITIAIEVPVVLLIIRRLYKLKEIEVKKILIVALLSSSLTLPYLWFILPLYFLDRSTYVIVGETLVIIVEAVIYKKLLKLKWSEAIVTSLTANLASVTIGQVFQI